MSDKTTFSIEWVDPNPIGKVSYYRILMKDANGTIFADFNKTAPTYGTDPHRSYTALAKMPSALPISIVIYAINNGVYSEERVFVSDVSKPSPVESIGLTIT